jgi:putative phosphoesterase
MKIAVVSDTHGRIDAWKKAEAIFTGADLIVHAGDVLYHPPRLGCSEGYDIPAMADALNQSPIPIVIAQGNCDAQVYEELLEMPVQAPYALAVINGLRILVSHGHLHTKEQMIDLGKRYKADVFISGHTHIPVLERVDSMVLMNPGSPSIPKFERDGKLIGSVGLITDTELRIVSVENGETFFSLPRI